MAPVPVGGQLGAIPQLNQRKRWAAHTNRVGMTGALLCGAFGFLTFVLTGNWLAIPVLAVLGGLIAAIPFWLVSSLADVIRGVR